MDLVRSRSRIVPGVRQRTGLNEDVGSGRRVGKVQRTLGQRERSRQAVGAVSHRKGARGVDGEAPRSGDSSGPGGVIPGPVAQLDGGVPGNLQFPCGRVRPGKNQFVAALDVQSRRINHIAGIKQVTARACVVDAVGSGPSHRNGLDEFARSQRGGRTAVAKGKNHIPLPGVHGSHKTGEVSGEDGGQRRVACSRRSQVGPGVTRQVAPERHGLVGIAVQPASRRPHMNVGIDGIGGITDKKAASVQLQAGAAKGGRIRKGHFIPRGVGAVAHQLERARKTAVVSADGITASSGESSSLLVPQHQGTGPGNAAGQRIRHGAGMGAVVPDLKSGILRDGDVSAPGPGGAVGPDIIEKRAAADGDGAGEGASQGRVNGQQAVPELDDVLVPQFLGIGGPRNIIAVRIHLDGPGTGGGVNEAGNILRGPRAVRENATCKNELVGRYQPQRSFRRSRRVQHQFPSVQRHRAGAQALDGIQVEGAGHDGRAAGERIGPGIFNGHLPFPPFNEGHRIRAVYKGSRARERIGRFPIVDRKAGGGNIPVNSDGGEGHACQVFKVGGFGGIINDRRPILVQPDGCASRCRPRTRGSSVPVEGFTQRLDAQVKGVSGQFQGISVIAGKTAGIKGKVAGRQRAEAVCRNQLVVVFHRLVHPADRQGQRTFRIEGKRAAGLDDGSAGGIQPRQVQRQAGSRGKSHITRRGKTGPGSHRDGIAEGHSAGEPEAEFSPGNRQGVRKPGGGTERKLARAALGEGAPPIQNRGIGNDCIRARSGGYLVKPGNGRVGEHVRFRHAVQVQHAFGDHIPAPLAGKSCRPGEDGVITRNGHVGQRRGQGSAVDLLAARINGGIVERASADGKVGFPDRQCGTGVVAFHIRAQGYLRSVKCTPCNRDIGGTNISGKGSRSGSINVGTAPDLACIRPGLEGQVGGTCDIERAFPGFHPASPRNHGRYRATAQVQRHIGISKAPG